ncbi:MAG: arginine N-succinyltransferase [Oceanospirillales bacterium]|uniref:Arginine N-succinyltransferase n=1 Tax=Marinobacterium halophilum TaxID=267374 RepID=A0A2P8F3I5_9GAMM|nr:arginine N-succinyltransferase [Marinobacterium halophilum]MBR9827850.1 arginine N-succinyltransferase [Oceanospirillales bacterium]PSL16285.1 arginine succinyltransferase [Marinobacterium halophilum]
MLLLRPVEFRDLQGLERLAVDSGGSLTTLPANRDHLNELIDRTLKSLRKAVNRPEQESYHFVLEDSHSGEIVGVSGIEAAVGIASPFYSYRINEVVHASSELQIHNRIPALHLCQDFTGASRLCTLFLDSEHRQRSNLHLLSRARLLFIAAHRERFDSRIIAELQGVVDANGQSPFWESLGQHFFNMDFAKANYLTGIDSKGFIAELLPHHPVYLPLLSEAARESLGQPRTDAARVKALLEDEGFGYRGYVDIFDAGPTLEAQTDRLRSLVESRSVTITVNADDEEGDKALALVAHGQLENFRCLLAEVDAQQPELTPAQAEVLNVSNGDCVQLVWL